MSSRENKGLSPLQAITYSSGNLSAYLINQVIVMWAIYFYAPGQGGEHEVARGVVRYAPIALLGYAMLFGRVVDAVADPLVGYWSDSMRTRFGRRIPFVLAGTPFLALFAIVLWRPPVAAESSANALYFAAVLGLFFFFYTVVVAPYLSMLPELVTSNERRVGLSTSQAFFGLLGLTVATLASGPLIDRYGFFTMGSIMAAITVVFSYLSVSLVREKRVLDAQAAPFNFVESVAASFKNTPFVRWIATIGLFWVGFNVVQMGGPYYITVLLKGTKTDASVMQAVTLLVVVPMLPVVYLAAGRFGKRRLILAAMVGLSAITPLFALTPYVEFMPKKIFAYLLFGLLGLPVSVLMALASAVIADVVDHDEKLTGRRREAMYFGMQGLVTKSAIGVSSVVGTQLFFRFGYSADNYTGILLTGPFSAVFTFLGFLVFYRYSIDK
ncbi:MAG: MFS transporter [Pseudomonadota bacterium]